MALSKAKEDRLFEKTALMKVPRTESNSCCIGLDTPETLLGTLRENEGALQALFI